MTRLQLTIIFSICFFVEVQAQKVEPHIKFFAGKSFPTFSEAPIADYYFSITRPTVVQLNVSIKVNHIEVGLLAEAEDAKYLEYSYYDLVNDLLSIPPTSRLGGYINYYPNLGSKRFAPYGGLSLERSYFMYGGGFTTGTSPTFEIARDNSFYYLTNHAENGYSLSMMLGSLYHFSPTFSLDFQMRYSAWIEEEAITTQNVTYKKNNQAAYSFTIRENRLMPIFLLGINANLAGNNY